MKRSHYLSIITLIVLALLCPGCRHHAENPRAASPYLAELDEELSQRDGYAAERELRIKTSLTQLATVSSDTDAYNICRSLFSAYRNYRTDSALWIAGQRLTLATAINDSSKINSASLNLAECLSVAANYSEALKILDNMDRAHLAPYHIQYLFNIYCNTYERMSMSDGLESNKLRYRMLYRQYMDSALNVYPTDSRDYHYFKARRLLDAGYPANALKEMDNMSKTIGSIGDDPRMLYEAGLIYNALGRKDDEIDALAQSALMYIRNGQRDYPSLMNLAAALNENGDPARAYRYIMAALEDASFCNSRSRTSQIQELVPLISAAHSSMEKESLRRAWTLTFIIIFLALANGACFVWAYAQLMKKRRMSMRLEEAIGNLKAINSELENANRDKINFINRLFGIYSDYINRIGTYRSKIIKLLKISQPRAALDYLESNKIVSDELKDMYRRFDAIFIELYPEFIPAYNSLVHPSEQLPPDTRTLPAKVRVLALMKVGVTEPADIARLLHYTPQTIYNYCSHLRAASRVPYSEFEKTILAPEKESSMQP